MTDLPSAPPAPSDPASQADLAIVVARLRNEVARVVVGQDLVIDHLLTAFLAGGHVLVEGVPGLGKTMLVLALSRAIGGSSARVQFTPDLMPTDVTGHVLYDTRSGEFKVHKGPVFANLLLADEINRAPAKTQSALLELMQEQQVTIEGTAHALPTPFMTMATQNPLEQEGTYPLPEAQLDRFLLHVHVDYPSAEDELQIVRTVTGGSIGDGLDVAAVQPVIRIEEARALQEQVARIYADDRVLAYAVALVRATRDGRGLAMGAGPRGAISLVRAARAWAVLQGRTFVTPDDVRDMCLPALRHRVVVAPELEVEGLDRDEVLRRALDGVEAPRT